MFKTFFSQKRGADKESDVPEIANLSRRKFLGAAGVASSAVVLASCTKNDTKNEVNLGSGDVGILNYAYALEQLEAAFYTQVIASPYGGMSAQERSYLTDIRDHEVAHREFFKAAITAAGATPIPNLDVNFNTINFGDRNSVLSTAIAFEDLGVSAYNGAGKLITNGDYLVIAGKIVSVEARHAALVRDLLSNGTFANTTDANGMDVAMTPAQVLQVAGFYVKTPINISNLPTS
jgi:rubrerythrin